MTITVVMLGKFVLFLMGRSRAFFWIWIKFHLGRAKGRGKRRYEGEEQNKDYFCKIPIIQQDTSFISHTVCQTNFWSPPLWLVCPKTYMLWLSSNFEQFFLVKNNLLTSAHNDIDDYYRVIGIAQLNAFTCAKKKEKIWSPPPPAPRGLWIGKQNISVQFWTFYAIPSKNILWANWSSNPQGWFLMKPLYRESFTKFAEGIVDHLLHLLKKTHCAYGCVQTS